MVQVIVAVIGLVGVIITVVVTARTTRDTLTKQLEINQAVTNTEISHIKDEMGELKTDIKEHNNYAKHMPVMAEQISGIVRRIELLESK